MFQIDVEVCNSFHFKNIYFTLFHYTYPLKNMDIRINTMLHRLAVKIFKSLLNKDMEFELKFDSK